MKKMILVVTVIMALAVTGCRSRKMYETATMSDSLMLKVENMEVLKEAEIQESRDTWINEETRIDFTSSNGMICIRPDGSMAISRVASITGKRQTDTKSATIARLRADSASLYQQTFTKSDSHADVKGAIANSDIRSWTKHIIVSFAVILIIAMTARYTKEK